MGESNNKDMSRAITEAGDGSGRVSGDGMAASVGEVIQRSKENTLINTVGVRDALEETEVDLDGVLGDLETGVPNNRLDVEDEMPPANELPPSTISRFEVLDRGGTEEDHDFPDIEVVETPVVPPIKVIKKIPLLDTDEKLGKVIDAAFDDLERND